MTPRVAAPVGRVTARTLPTTRRGTPWQERSPNELWPAAAAATADRSQGQPPAQPRLAISTRVHQTGGAPTRLAPTRRGHPTRAPPPRNPPTHTPRPRCTIIRSRAGTSRAPYGRRTRSGFARPLTRPPDRDQPSSHEAKGPPRPAPKQPPAHPRTRTHHHHAVLTLDRALPHQFMVGGILGLGSWGGGSAEGGPDHPAEQAEDEQAAGATGVEEGQRGPPQRPDRIVGR